jgi:hypothetical protein
MKSFELSLKVDDCFSALINEVDLRAETLLRHKNLTEYEIDRIEIKRAEYLKVIEDARLENRLNLELKLEANKNSDLEIEASFSKYCFLVDFLPKKYNVCPKTGKFKFKGDLVKTDFIDEHFGYLVICNDYISDKQLDLYYKLLKIEHRITREGEEDLFYLIVRFLSEFKT